MRRAAVCSLDLAEIDFETKSVTVREKGGQTHRYKISKEAVKAIKDYLREERGAGRRDVSPLPGALPPRRDGRQQFRPPDAEGDQHRLERGLPLGERQGQDSSRRPPCDGPAHHEVRPATSPPCNGSSGTRTPPTPSSTPGSPMRSCRRWWMRGEKAALLSGAFSHITLYNQR